LQTLCNVIVQINIVWYLFCNIKANALKKVNMKYVRNRLWLSIFYIGPGISPRPVPPIQLRCRAWYGSPGLIPGRYGKWNVIISYYHIFCCNMFIFACSIIARSQRWSYALRANICIYLHTFCISVFALKYPYLPPNWTTGICAVVSKIICLRTRKDDA
jgi:hypothetical protein